MEEREALRENLARTDVSLGFILLALLGTMLFFLSTVRGREELRQTILGRESPGGEDVIRRLNWAGGALITGATGWFFWAAADNYSSARGSGKPTATRNLWAAGLVLAATLLRLWDREAAPVEAQADEFE